jgi:cyclophilin family peptidyl-prolyl cis-trans isomerase
MNKTAPIVIAVLLVLAAIVFAAWKISKPDETASNNTNTSSSQNSNTQSNQENTNQPANTNSVAQEPSQGEAVDKDCTPKTFTKEQLSAAYTQKPKFVIMDVAGYGTMKIALDYLNAPKTSTNFAKLASLGFYDCLSFHRIADITANCRIIQGGDPAGNGTGGPGYTVPAEIKLTHKKGTIAMARLGDDANPKRDSSGSQFYINVTDVPVLDGQYTVFGKIVEGLDAAVKIGAAERGLRDAPVKPIIITKATVSDK